MARVLHLISHLEEGGAQRQLAYLISHARDAQMEIAALIASPPERLFRDFRDCNIPIHFLTNSSDFYAPQILPALNRLLSANRYDVVHCWLFQSIVQGVIAARRKGIPSIASPRGQLAGFQYDGNRAWERRLIRKAIPLADVVLVPSSTVALELLENLNVDPSRLRVVRNGVDTDYFQPGGSGEAVVSIARVSAEKGIEDLQTMAVQLTAEFDGLEILALGGMRASLPQNSPVKFLGYQDDIRPVLRKAAVFVSTAKVEGMSNAILEAQSMGIPVVARKIGSNSEVVEHGVTGYLFDTIDDMSDACKLLLRDRSLRVEMGKAAREFILARFRIQTQIAKIEAIYDELLGLRSTLV